MKEKEKVIIKSAIRLFAEKGYTSTSVQEIVQESGISKGAFYLSFKSKEALLVAILNYYSETLENRILKYENLQLPPKEKFINQLIVMTETLLEHKEFIIMHSREQAIPLNDEVKKLIFKMHIKMHQLYHDNFLNIYGKKITPYLWDASTILEGIYQSYLRILFFDREAFDIHSLSSFIFNRMDTLVNDLLNQKEGPLLSNQKVTQFLNKAQVFFEDDNRNINAIIAKMKQELIEVGSKEDLEVSLEVLEAEISRDTPRPAIIQGMLSNFAFYPEFNVYINQIKKIYHLS